VLVVLQTFASADGQASTLGGLCRYSARRTGVPEFHPHHGRGHGRLHQPARDLHQQLWPANSPYGLTSIGTSSILDPTGEPLAGAPDPQTGGVYAGNLTPRMPAQVIPGALNFGAVGTALLGHSPENSTRAVFSVVCADDSLVQEHTGKGPRWTRARRHGRRPAP